MHIKIFDLLNNQKGDSILGFVIILSAVAILVAAILPGFNQAFEDRQQKSVDYFNSTDTITQLE